MAFPSIGFGQTCLSFQVALHVSGASTTRGSRLPHPAGPENVPGRIRFICGHAHSDGIDDHNNRREIRSGALKNGMPVWGRGCSEYAGTEIADRFFRAGDSTLVVACLRGNHGSSCADRSSTAL
jgi:hypothetical protein